ncbi:unnamed protein product, partial [Iphiclides podalirius]
MSTEMDPQVIQYVPFMSFVHPSFWHSLTDIKLNVDKLNENNNQITGRYTYRDDVGTVFEVDCTSFNRVPDTEQFYLNVTGTVMNKNTIEDFKNIDKAALLNGIGELIWPTIKAKTWIPNPKCLLNFIVLSFADLKKFHYFYWFAFPSPSQPTVYLKQKSEPVTSIFNNKQLEELDKGFKCLDTAQKYFFVITKNGDSIEVGPLSTVLDSNKSEQSANDIEFSKRFFAFADPSNGSNAGWPLRLLIAALLDHCPDLGDMIITVIGLRCSVGGGINNSYVYNVKIPQNVQKTDAYGWVGWERNDKGNFGPKLANMSASMDPIKLADASSDLNIKLMKWRLVPNIDIDVMRNTKCLLLGAGTLGCHVARGLLAWGFRHITLLDNGNVSYSNPTRQVLFNHKDCVDARKKAVAAADNLRLILPTVQSRGIVAHIPMPGHPVGDSLVEETMASLKLIIDSIIEHDVIFLLLDTREARWLPTVIAANHGKIVINAALGFDSYLVMRHGVALSNPGNTASVDNTFVPGGQLGCYFCNDVTAPGNSMKDRTLDQQCTVTRPGVASIAGALAVEMLVGLLQHPLGVDAPAVYNLNDDGGEDADMQGVLGPVPHSIRGFLHSFQTIMPTYAKFKQCIACSDVIINKYRDDGVKFLMEVFNSGKYLEQLSGLEELQWIAEVTELLVLSDEDTE